MDSVMVSENNVYLLRESVTRVPGPITTGTGKGRWYSTTTNMAARLLLAIGFKTRKGVVSRNLLVANDLWVVSIIMCAYSCNCLFFSPNNNNKKLHRGRGKMTFVDSESCYDGEFFDDFYQGQGKWILPDGVVFEGLFERNCLVNGVIWESFFIFAKVFIVCLLPHLFQCCVLFWAGKITYLDSSTYQGQLKDHQPCGNGTFERAHVERYEVHVLFF